MSPPNFMDMDPNRRRPFDVCAVPLERSREETLTRRTPLRWRMLLALGEVAELFGSGLDRAVRARGIGSEGFQHRQGAVPPFARGAGPPVQGLQGGDCKVLICGGTYVHVCPQGKDVEKTFNVLRCKLGRRGARSLTTSTVLLRF